MRARRAPGAWSAVVLTAGLLACSAPAEPRRPAQDEVVYGVVPALWQRGDEPAARAVRRELARVAELGATIVWLWPPVHAREPGEEYAVTDYTALDDQWGDAADLTALVEDAHALGLRVIVDVVLNHTSREHPWFSEASGPEDATWGYYERADDGSPEHYLDWAHLPNLDVDHPEVRAHLVDSLVDLVGEVGVDGFRLDAAWGPARRSTTFWRDVVDRVRDADPDAFLLAEADVDEPWLDGLGIDAAYDWGTELGQWAWQDVWTAARPAHAMASLLSLEVPDGGPAVLRYLDTNDTGTRFAVTHGPEVAAVAAVLEVTAPGVPLVFAGQESALDYEPYEALPGDGQRIEADADEALGALYRSILALRARSGSLRSPDVGSVRAEGDVLVLERPAGRDGGRVVVLANLGGTAVTDVPAPAGVLAVATQDGVVVEPAGHGASRVDLPPRSAAVLEVP